MIKPIYSTKMKRDYKYDCWALEHTRTVQALNKEAKKEADKTNPIEVRRTNAKNLAKNIFSDKQEVYEMLYEKLDNRVDELYNLIIQDLGLDKDENLTLNPCNVYEIFNYYYDKGLCQLNDASTEEMMKYNKNKTAPYSKLFKKLINKRAEFMIVAPKERLTSSSPFKSIQDQETQIELLKHMEELNLLPNDEFLQRYPKLYSLYKDMKENNLEV